MTTKRPGVPLVAPVKFTPFNVNPAQQKKKPKTRLDFRLDTEAKEVITQAAHLTGKSLSEFAVSSLVRSAHEVLEKHQTITLSNHDFDAFLKAIESDEEPNDALKWAAERYQQRFGGRGSLL